MMNFRVLKANLQTILSDAAASRYQVVGYQQQGSDVSEFVGTDRRVQVFYGAGEFPKDKASQTSSTQHEVTFRIELTASADAKGDLTVINDPLSTAGELAAAIADFQVASSEADDSVDELFDIIYQILMDGNNRDIGTTGPPFIVGDRWVSGMTKDNPLNAGEYVAITGAIEYTCQVIEPITGDTGTAAGTGPFDQVLDLDGDDNEQTGVLV